MHGSAIALGAGDARLLLAGSTQHLRMDFPKSGVVAMDLGALEPGAGELRFFLRPKMVR